jgi:glycosyltransferase involved in cell wall biosynthesis
VRILVDYRPALRERTGVGEYVHQLMRALAATRLPGLDETVHLFSSSWKDRLEASGDLGAIPIDRRVPVRLLNYAWHRWGWPPVERVAGVTSDVVHSMHPLLIPSRGAAQVVTIYDLDFLDHPERARAEIRRDYPALARSHAARADRVVVISKHTSADVERRLGVPPSRISVVSPIAPDWPRREHEPASGYILFVGTLDARKNVGVLLDAYARLLERRTDVPRLVLAGRPTPDAEPWLTRAAAAPLAGHVDVLGYVPADDRLAVYEGALALVLPSHHEGFGIPVLEAMTIGVPVVVANRGALPEVAGDAGLLFDPADPEALVAALAQVLDDAARRASMRERGWRRAEAYSQATAASAVREAWALAGDERRRRG